jgi:hypothetical protein
MNGKKLHTALLEDLFGPIRLRILKQENPYRMVHLLDKDQISRTMGIVRFRNTDHPVIEAAHGRIVAGELLGKTLLEGQIPYTKATLFQYDVCLPEWVSKDFMSDQNTTVANYSRITIEDRSNGTDFLYAELFEIIPPEIIHLIPKPPMTHKATEEDCVNLLSFAGITVALNDTES